MCVLLSRPGAVTAGSPMASLAAWPPAGLALNGSSTVARAVRGVDGNPPGHPIVQVEGEALMLKAGPLPQYPLYYARSVRDDYLLACSHLEPLARLLPLEPLNAERLVSLLVWPLDLDSRATVYRGIQRLRPCEAIVADGEVVRLSRDFPRVGQAYRREKPAALAAELRDRLGDAVERAIGGAKRVAVFVSGGLDSSGVLALALARCRGATAREVTALSVQFAGPGDDRPYLAELSSALGLAPMKLSTGDLGKWLTQSLCVDGQPAWHSSGCIDLALCAAAVCGGADVALTGIGGDRVCGGTLPFAQLARRGRIVTALNAALRVRVPWRSTPWGRLRELASSLIPRTLSRLRRRRSVDPSWLTSRSRSLLASLREASKRVAAPLPDTPDAWMKDLCQNYLLCDAADLAGQTLSVTGCAPVDVFIDFEFVRFMLAIDPIMLCHGHEYRGLYRLAMKGLVPERLRTRQDKASFESALAAAIVAGQALDELRDLSSLDALATRNLVDPARIRSTLDAWLASMQRGERTEIDPTDGHSMRAWQLLSVEAFLRQHGRDRNLA